MSALEILSCTPAQSSLSPIDKTVPCCEFAHDRFIICRSCPRERRKSSWAFSFKFQKRNKNLRLFLSLVLLPRLTHLGQNKLFRLLIAEHRGNYSIYHRKSRINNRKCSFFFPSRSAGSTGNVPTMNGTAINREYSLL